MNLYSRIDGSGYRNIWVVGDLHGCYTRLMSELHRVDFDPAQDLLISVGDLIDRGTENVECLERLQNALSGNYPATPDSWISCSERMPDTKTAVLVAVEFDRKGDWRMKWATYIPGHPDANDGWIIPGASWKPSHWMPLPEPPEQDGE
ncbi:DUF551 domain-containing protein [Escherichia coli]|nr:DUF551 domain-containing protein [Escherichia coli]